MRLFVFQLCDSLKRDYMPKAAKDVYGVKHFLLNPDSGDYQQLVETEHCRWVFLIPKPIS